MLDTRKNAIKKFLGILFVSEGPLNDDASVYQQAPYFGIYGRELVSKSGNFDKEKLRGGATVERLNYFLSAGAP